MSPQRGPITRQTDLFDDRPPVKAPDLVIFTDGACFGNPGPAAAAAVVTCNGEVIVERTLYLGESTNNRAEYEAVILALAAAAELGAASVTLRTDSQLVARQITGRYKIKNPGLKPLLDKIKELSGKFKFKVVEIPREENSRADRLAKNCIKDSS